MTFGQFLSILRARKWVALMVFLLVVATTVAVSLLLPKQYTGTASVVIDVKPDQLAVMSNPSSLIFIFTALYLFYFYFCCLLIFFIPFFLHK